MPVSHSIVPDILSLEPALKPTHMDAQTLLIPISDTPLSMTPEQAKDYSKQQALQWESNLEDAEDQVWDSYIEEIKAAYQKDKWEIEQQLKKEEIEMAMEAEAHAAEQAKMWQEKEIETKMKKKQAEDIEQHAASQADLWTKQESMMQDVVEKKNNDVLDN